MSPALSAAIYAARELAWQSHVNLSSRERYVARHAAHQRLVDALVGVRTVSGNASPELRFLVEQMHRIALCSFANRKGHRYYERKQAMAELRGCLLAYDKAREVAA